MKRHSARFMALVAFLTLVAVACSPDEEGVNADATSGSSVDSTIASTSTTLAVADVNQFCPESPFGSIGQSVEIKRAWLDECTTEVQDWLIEVRSNQWITFANTGADDWSVQLGTYEATIPAGVTLDSPPVDTVLQPGVDYQLGVTTTINLKDVSFGPLEGAEILLQRVGPVGPGQTLGEITANTRHPVDLDDSYEFFLPDCVIAGFRGADGVYMLFAGNGQELRLQYLEVIEPGLATRSGIEVGDSSDDVYATYGAQIEARKGFGTSEGESLVFLPEADTTFGLIFIIQDDIVIGIRQGFADAVGLTEACA